MVDQEINARLRKVEANVDVCMSTNLALMAAFASLPEAARVSDNKTTTVLRGLVSQQVSLAALEETAQLLLRNLLANAREASRH